LEEKLISTGPLGTSPVGAFVIVVVGGVLTVSPAELELDAASSFVPL
jgi:hypothetical protein